MYQQNRNEICKTGGIERASTSTPDEPRYKIHHGQAMRAISQKKIIYKHMNQGKEMAGEIPGESCLSN
jgi:hypothetical protein